MSMSGVSITSRKGLQFEGTQDAYTRVVVRLNLLLMKDKTHEAAVREKLIEVMKERNKLGKYSASDLYVMQKSIEKTVEDFLAGLDEKYITA
ncbi:hypothetical protein GCM10016272_27790 [Psychrobacter glaciei]|uniref:Uncharacterized protein n=1 Tax=Psychrobacter glaciei TaxID=619771 RepID=A0ABQ3GU19_9GAMM|nr:MULTISPECIES: hypothetical protein [Psychrobacter]GHD38561.1 hypothetical protein GCM10016272_27790 [Psychrobacter glaciei]